MMRHVPLATVKDKLSEYAAAAASGDEIVVTKHGRPYVRLVAMAGKDGERAQQVAAAVTRMRTLRAEILASGDGIALDDIVEMIREDRR